MSFAIRKISVSRYGAAPSPLRGTGKFVSDVFGGRRSAATSGRSWPEVARRVSAARRADEDNLRARRLYEHFGYAFAMRRRVGWNYRDGDDTIEVTEDCWVLEKDVALGSS